VTAYGLVEAWEDTRLWCPLCGRRRLEGQFDSASGEFSLRCPGCYPTTGVYCSYQLPDLFKGVRGYRPALGRVMRWANAYYRPALEVGTAPCPGCGRPLTLRREQAPQVLAELADRRNARGVHVYCERCAAACSMRLSNLTLYLPQAWQFWRTHPRLQILPDRDVEMDGQEVIVTRLQSVTGSAFLDVIAARDTFKVLRVHDATGV
jgi:hypothetical protein